MKVKEITSVTLGLAIAFGGIAGAPLAHAGAEIIQAARPVTIDILPNRKENEVKLSDKDKSLQVVLMGEANFAVSQIEAVTVEMEGVRPVSLNGRRVNVNIDSYADIEYRFQIGKLPLTEATTELCLTGKLRDGQVFKGCGEIIVKP